MQRRLFADRAVDVRGYLACALVLGAASALAAGIGLLAFKVADQLAASPAVIIWSSVVVVRQLRIVMLL